jgi:hypothetical protein
MDQVVSATFILAEETELCRDERGVEQVVSQGSARPPGGETPHPPKGMKVSIAVIAEG